MHKLLPHVQNHQCCFQVNPCCALSALNMEMLGWMNKELELSDTSPKMLFNTFTQTCNKTLDIYYMREALTHFAVFSSESVRTHTSVAPSLFPTGASITTGARSTCIKSNWKETVKKQSLKQRVLRLLITQNTSLPLHWDSSHNFGEIAHNSVIHTNYHKPFSTAIFQAALQVMACFLGHEKLLLDSSLSNNVQHRWMFY